MAPSVVGPASVHRFSLDNGLAVQLAPVPDSPTASVWVWYRVGSKNEWPGVTGASHWVEHMLFQGSPKYGKGAIDRAVVQVGGSLNAFTDTDFTAYFTTVPRQHLDLPLDIEADRMTRALFEPAEVERERTVIRSEREGNENWPEFRAEEELYHLAYRAHPYRWDALGLPGDILALTPAQLAGYYRRFYGTRNAVLVVAGGFKPATVRTQIERMFSGLPGGGDDPRVTTVEPPPNASRRATLRGPGTTPYLQVGWRAPAIDDPALPAALLVDVLLGGESRLFTSGSGWGRSREHPSSRLYRALVDPGLAVRATSEFRPRLHPGQFTVQVQATGGASPARIERALDGELDRLAEDGPSESEVGAARTTLRRAALLSYEGATRIGFRLGYFSLLGPPRFEARLLAAMLRVTPAGARAAAQALFRPESRTTVWYEPEVRVDGE